MYTESLNPTQPRPRHFTEKAVDPSQKHVYKEYETDVNMQMEMRIRNLNFNKKVKSLKPILKIRIERRRCEQIQNQTTTQYHTDY